MWGLVRALSFRRTPLPSSKSFWQRLMLARSCIHLGRTVMSCVSRIQWDVVLRLFLWRERLARVSFYKVRVWYIMCHCKWTWNSITVIPLQMLWPDFLRLRCKRSGCQSHTICRTFVILNTHKHTVSQSARLWSSQWPHQSIGNCDRDSQIIMNI